MTKEEFTKFQCERFKVKPEDLCNEEDESDE
jgi:hypothetical protein